MRRIGIRELRQDASKYLRLVKAGETIEVTDRGEPVARLTPVPPQPKSRWDELVERGEIIPATRSLADLPPPLAPEPGMPSLSEILDEMREERLP